MDFIAFTCSCGTAIPGTFSCTCRTLIPSIIVWPQNVRAAFDLSSQQAVPGTHQVPQPGTAVPGTCWLQVPIYHATHFQQYLRVYSAVSTLTNLPTLCGSVRTNLRLGALIS